MYAADHDGVWQLRNDGLERVDMGFDRKVTTNRLQAGNGVLWSVGSGDLAVLDGIRWAQLSAPDP